ncbi:hypothetical protein HG264_04170 [Pseudomonas sp. gcc21]|uniref:hypothetical protein n=1 Tax=Pseudomonas sp. gcc21 TaxID=2726989 RepID=UPI001452187D|nr:hypothetical protein [Pseudomonas sp. gcc21]QJD58167.1 hypothetical protein HG264_04170 [Pseudomonas sp. gcc21]
MQPIIIESAGRRVLPSTQPSGTWWQLTMGGRVIGWAEGYPAAVAKRERYEAARSNRHAQSS